jgi:DNA-binding response OmpR family regulator
VANSPAKAGSHRRTKDPTVPTSAHALETDGRRIVICDHNALLLSVTGLLRMSGFVVFQAYDARAALELCHELPNIELLILNTTGTGTDSPTLVRQIREQHPSLPVLHIGPSVLEGMPANVPTLQESFSAEQLLAAVRAQLPARVSLLRPAG